MAKLTMQELGAAPDTPSSGKWVAYFKSDGLYIKDDAGTETGPFGTGGGGSNSICDGRLTLESGVALSTTNQTAKTTVYFTPYHGNKIALYDGSSAWDVIEFAEASVAVPATTNTPFDIFAYNNSGTIAFETVNWTNDTTRATALAKQDGVSVKTGATTRRYLGTGRTTGTSGQCEDSLTFRYIWNKYNQHKRPILVVEGTDSWIYNSSTFRAWNNSTGNRASFVLGLSEDPVKMQFAAYVYHTAGGTNNVRIGIGLDSATVDGSTARAPIGSGTATAAYNGYPGVGGHYLQMLEKGNGSNDNTFYGDNGGSDKSAAFGEIVG